MINKNNKTIIIVVFVLLILGLFLRIYDLKADLSPNITFSGSIYTDEGNQCHNSRSYYLYGDWFPDDWKITNYNPILPYFKLLIFKLFGVGLVQVRIVNIIFAFFSILFFYLSFKYIKNDLYSLLGLLFISVNYLYLMYNRISTFETSMIFWMILSIYFLYRLSISNKSIWAYFSGFSAFMSFVFKMTAAHFLPVPLLSIIIYYWFSKKGIGVISKKQKFIIIASYLSGILSVFLIWLILFYIPNYDWIRGVPGTYIGKQMFPRSISQAFNNVFAFNWKQQFYKIPIVWILSLFYVNVFFRRLLDKKVDSVETGFVLYFFSHTSAFLIMNHRPTRYLIAVIPSMIFMTVMFLKYIYEYKPEKSINNFKKIIFFVFDFIWFIFISYYALIPFLRKFLFKSFYPNIKNLIIIVGVLFIIKFVFNLIFKRFDLKFLKYSLIFSLIIISVIVNFKYYFKWKNERTHYVYNMAIDLKQNLKNAYIAGLTAPVAVLESEHKSLFLYPGFVNWDSNTLKKYKITHALLASFNWEINNFFNQWPEYMKRAKLLRVYNVKDQFLHLYSFVDPYIKDVKYDNQKFYMNIINPTKESMNINIGYIKIFDNNFKVYKDVNTYQISEGKNRIETSFNIDGAKKILFFIDHNTSFANTYVYEAEKFPYKTGYNHKDKTASMGYLRCFDPKKNSEGFLISSINGNFIDFSEGLIILKIKIKGYKLLSKIRNVLYADIYSNTLKKPLSKVVIKGKELLKNKEISFFALVNGVQNLEFRIKTTKYMKFCVDFIEMKYFQGKIVKLD